MQVLSNFERVMAFLVSSGRPRSRVVVVCPHDSHTLKAVELALEREFADFVFVGRADDTNSLKLAEQFPEKIDLVDCSDADEAARIAVGMIRGREADVLMKGLINTDNLLRAVLNKHDGILKPGKVLSHITAAEINGMSRLVFFSDAAVIPFPTLEQHAAMTGYLADVCHAFGIDVPRIALIHCNEKTSEKFPVTISYRQIKEMAFDGLFGKAIVDGPMDVKTALDAHAAEVKGIVSPIDGKADALVFPDIEAGNTFYKTISFFAHSLNAGMLVGAQAPVVLPSRSDSPESKLCSLAMASLYRPESQDI